MKYVLCLIIGIFFVSQKNLHAQLKRMTVSPEETDGNIQKINGDHLALYDPESTAGKNQLIVMIQGTGGHPDYMYDIDSIFATMGYHVVSIDYANNVISTVCAQSLDSSCSYRFRMEIMTGRELSGKTEVDSVNSFLHRLTSFLAYLTEKDPQGDWDQFYAGDTIRWNRIIAAGHSQGAGHAALIGKLFRVNKVLLFSGPQDYLEALNQPSPWLKDGSATPEDRYFAFLHREDPFNSSYQIENCKALMKSFDPRPLTLKELATPLPDGSHILISEIEAKEPHGSTLDPRYQAVWEYMLE